MQVGALEALERPVERERAAHDPSAASTASRARSSLVAILASTSPTLVRTTVGEIDARIRTKLDRAKDAAEAELAT